MASADRATPSAFGLDFGKVRYFAEQRPHFLQQPNPVLAHVPFIGHHHDFLEELVDRSFERSDLPEYRGVVVGPGQLLDPGSNRAARITEPYLGSLFELPGVDL